MAAQQTASVAIENYCDIHQSQPGSRINIYTIDGEVAGGLNGCRNFNGMERSGNQGSSDNVSNGSHQ